MNLLSFSLFNFNLVWISSLNNIDLFEEITFPYCSPERRWEILKGLTFDPKCGVFLVNVVALHREQLTHWLCYVSFIQWHHSKWSEILDERLASNHSNIKFQFLKHEPRLEKLYFRPKNYPNLGNSCGHVVPLGIKPMTLCFRCRLANRWTMELKTALNSISANKIANFIIYSKHYSVAFPARLC